MRSSIIITIFLHLLISCSGGGGTSPDFFGNNGAVPDGDSPAKPEGSGSVDTGANPTDSFFDNSIGTASSISLSGRMSLGPVSGAYVEAYSFGRYGRLTGYCSDKSETTGGESSEKGRWTFKLYKECLGTNIIIKSEGGKYNEEADGEDGEEVTLSEDESLQTIVTEVSAEKAQEIVDSGGLGITPLSDIATERALALKQTDITMEEAVELASEEIEDTYGASPYVAPSNPEVIFLVLILKTPRIKSRPS